MTAPFPLFREYSKAFRMAMSLVCRVEQVFDSLQDPVKCVEKNPAPVAGMLLSTDPSVKYSVHPSVYAFLIASSAVPFNCCSVQFALLLGSSVKLKVAGNSSLGALPLYSLLRLFGFRDNNSSERLHFLAVLPIPADPRETGNQPGTSGSTGSAMRTPLKHHLTFLRPQHPQHPRLTANQNSGRRFDPDHPESGRLFKPARSSIHQDSALRSHRDSFSGSGLSSPALQRSHRDSFSGSPVGI